MHGRGESPTDGRVWAGGEPPCPVLGDRRDVRHGDHDRWVEAVDLVRRQQPARQQTNHDLGVTAVGQEADLVSAEIVTVGQLKPHRGVAQRSQLFNKGGGQGRVTGQAAAQLPQSLLIGERACLIGPAPLGGLSWERLSARTCAVRRIDQM